MRRTCTTFAVVAFALALAAPGTAQAPTLDERVTSLEDRVQAPEHNLQTLGEDNRFLGRRLDVLETAVEYLDAEQRWDRALIEELRTLVE